MSSPRKESMDTRVSCSARRAIGPSLLRTESSTANSVMHHWDNRWGISRKFLPSVASWKLSVSLRGSREVPRCLTGHSAQPEASSAAAICSLQLHESTSNRTVFKKFCFKVCLFQTRDQCRGTDGEKRFEGIR